MSKEEPINLFVVEDDEVDFMAIERAFKKLGVEANITRAFDGIEALEHLRSTPLDRPLMMLLDLNMPRMGGLEFLYTARKEGLILGVPVFVCTTSAAPGDISFAYQYQPAGYLLKSKPGGGFEENAKMLNQYWKTVEIPSSSEIKPIPLYEKPEE